MYKPCRITGRGGGGGGEGGDYFSVCLITFNFRDLIPTIKIDQSINQHFIDITLRIRYSHLQLKTKLQTNNRVINALQGGNPI